MIPANRQVLEAVQRRLEHTRATASLLAKGVPDDPMAEALYGIAATLEEQADRIEALLTA